MLEQVDKIKYSGCWKNKKLDPNQEIKCKIEQARFASTQMKGRPTETYDLAT